MSKEIQIFSMVPLSRQYFGLRQLSCFLGKRKTTVQNSYCKIENNEKYKLLLENIIKAKNNLGEFKAVTCSTSDSYDEFTLNPKLVYKQLNSSLNQVMLEYNIVRGHLDLENELKNIFNNVKYKGEIISFPWYNTLSPDEFD